MSNRIVVNRNGQPYLLTEQGLVPLHRSIMPIRDIVGKGINGDVPMPGYPVHQSLKSRIITQEKEREREEQAKMKDEQTAQEKEEDDVLSALSAISLKYGMGARSSTKR